MKWLKHAFAVESSAPLEPTETQRVLVEKLCFEVARRGMTTPALLLLEMSHPLNYVSAQALHFFQPVLSAITDVDGYQQFANFLEQRGSIEYICKRLEAAEAPDKR